MRAIISPSSISGSIRVPASKSVMQRTCALALLHKGETIIENPGTSNDDRAALSIITALGCKVEQGNDGIRVNSEGIVPVSNTFNCGESGLSFRMFSVIAALYDGELQINGSGSLLKRPFEPLLDILEKLEVEILSKKNEYPLIINGPIKLSEITVDGSLSSQYITGLLIAFAASAKEPVIVHVHALSSKPYVDLTLKMLHDFGYLVSHDSYKKFYVEPSVRSKDPICFHVEGDWSSAASLAVAAAIAGDIELHGLDNNSVQADRKVLLALEDAGVKIVADHKTIRVCKAKKMKAFEFDATDSPDLFPVLAVLACFCDGVSRITGVNRLTHKESNRAEAIRDEFAKMNMDVEIIGDIMFITGGHKLKAAKVFSHHDHRIAMALAILGLRAEGQTEIEDAGAVGKSYPDFFHHLQKLGASVSLLQ